MKARSWIVLLSLFSLLGCTQFPFNNEFVISTYPGTTNLEAFDVPDVAATANSFLDAWSDFDYPAMYALLTSVSRAAKSLEEFERHFQGVAAEAALDHVDYEILSTLVNPDSAQVGYRVNLSSVLVGDISRETVMNLSLERGEWRVQWDDTLVMPELKGGNYLSMDREGYIPSRANIYDRTGSALVGQADTTELILFPDQINPEQADKLFELLTQLTGLSRETIEAMYANFPSGQDWRLPLGEVPVNSVVPNYESLSEFSGLEMRPYKSRFYFDDGVAPHVMGYVSSIQPDEVLEYQRRGYQQDERVGRSGLEKWGEPYLAGKRGGALYVLNAQGRRITRLAETDAQSSQAIYTTLDKEFQMVAQQALSSFRGAVVVLERDTGRVLAMVSSPSFDPNAFEPINLNSSTSLTNIINDPSQPLFNRAAQGQYPLGSVFKIITMAAGLESGLYTPETTYQCGYFFEELEGVKLNDWTYDYFQENGKTQPSGTLTLPQGLMRSCNPFFWHIGLDLFNQGMETVVPELARGFGLGRPTGIEGVDEAEGQVLVPSSQLGATNLAIGQGDLLVTPLQVANFVAAIGNGGTLYQPQVVELIAPPDGDPTYSFEPKILGNLPVGQGTLRELQGAMVGVIRNEKPRGTAWHRFTGLDVPVAGKTGTAQTGSGSPHAWFAGYTFAEQEDRPDIAIAVVIENIGEGSDYAAPIFRRIVELYFSGQPQKLYWWESEYNVTSTPRLNSEGTPIPWVEATPEP